MEKMNVPTLRFLDFSECWQQVKLKDAFSIFNGFAFSSTDSSDTGARWIKIADVGIQVIKNDNISFLPIDFIDKYPKFILQEGDYVIALTRPILNGKLKLARIGIEANNSLLNQRVGKVISSNNTDFIYQLLQRQSLINAIENSIAGSDPPNLAPTEINNLKTFLPTLHEQNKIASFLTSVDDKIVLLNKKKELLTKYKKGVMQKLFNQEIRFKDEYGNDYPDWEENSVGEVYSFKITNSYSRDNLNYLNGLVKNIHYGDVHTKFSTLFDIKKEYVPYLNSEINLSRISSENYCEEGDLVIADASEDYNGVGKAIELTNLNNEKVLAGLHTILARPNRDKITIGFGGYLMQSSEIRAQINKIAQGSKVLSISSNRLSRLIFSLPCKPEQNKIANFLSSIDDKIRLITQQIEKSQAYKKGLLQKMFV